MSDPLESSRLLLDGGKEHIKDLDAKINAFFSTKPYAHVVERNADGTKLLYKVKFKESIPGPLKRLAATAANDLRHALDHAGYAAAVANGKTDPRFTYFPLAPSAAELENTIKGNCKDIPQEIVSVMRSFKPYKGGNDLLFALNRIAVANKHKLLRAIGIAPGGMFIDNLYVEHSGSGFALLSGEWDSAKNEIIFATSGLDTKVHYKLEIRFFVAFGDVEIVGGKPAIGTLNAMASEVSSILLAIEAEARRTGLFK